jgi:hypothetical protein
MRVVDLKPTNKKIIMSSKRRQEMMKKELRIRQEYLVFSPVSCLLSPVSFE